MENWYQVCLASFDMIIIIIISNIHTVVIVIIFVIVIIIIVILHLFPLLITIIATSLLLFIIIIIFVATIILIDIILIITIIFVVVYTILVVTFSVCLIYLSPVYNSYLVLPLSLMTMISLFKQWTDILRVITILSKSSCTFLSGSPIITMSLLQQCFPLVLWVFSISS